MPERELKVKLVFDAETKAFKVAQDETQELTDEMKELQQQLDKTKKKTGGLGEGFKKIGGIVGAIGVGAFFLDTVRRATEASDAMNELNTAWSETIGLLAEEFEPVIKKVTLGLTGLMSVLVGLVRFLRENLTGAFKGIIKIIDGDIRGGFAELQKGFASGTDLLLDKITEAGNRAAGITAAAEAIQSKIILEQTKIRLRNEVLSGKEKAKIINEAEEEALRILRASGEFLQASKRRQAKLELEIQKELASERQTARNQEITEAKAAAALEARQLTDRLNLLKAKQEEEMANQEVTDQRRIEMLEERFALELETIERQGELLNTSQEARETARINAALKHQAALQKVREKDLASQKKQAAELAKVQDASLKKQIAFAQARIASAASAAAAEFAISKNAASAARAAAAQSIRDLANMAAKAIAVKGAEATAKAFARGGGFPTGIPFAVATAAFYAGLSATVSAVGGAAAQRIAPPSGAGAPPAEVPAPVEVVTPAVPGETPAGAAPTPLGAPPTAGAVSEPGVSVTINTLGEIPPQVIRDVGEGIREELRR